MRTYSAVLFAALLLFCRAASAQEAYVPYIQENEMPDVVQIVPAPPQDPSPGFDYDILRYMWGKQQRKDSLRLQMAVRDAIWSMDTTLVILGEPFAYFQEPSIFPQDDEWLATGKSLPFWNRTPAMPPYGETPACRISGSSPSNQQLSLITRVGWTSCCTGAGRWRPE